ncbi:MAG: helix-turn-helix domain-containing protein [Gaiellaceae bacterium]
MTEEDGVVARSVDVDGLTLAELQFSAGYVQAPFEPELPYLAVVLAGCVEKTFRPKTIHLSAAAAVTMPSGAVHGARFGCEGARILIVKPSRAAACLHRLVELRGRGLDWLAWRLAAELRASDAAAPLAAQGLALELLAATTRETSVERRQGRPATWLRTAEETLRARADECVRLSELAEAVDVHPTHLARAFRLHYGVSVGEYGRRLRLGRAAAELAGTDIALATVATRAGFSDQSHFTRLFKLRTGATPARYRQQTQSTLRTFQDP